MKLVVNRESFLRALRVANAAVPSRTTRDVLKNVLLKSTPNAITLLGSDLDVGLRVEVSDVIHADSGVCLLPSRVIQILNELQCETVRFEVASGAIWIRSDASEFRLSTEDPDGFPEIKTFPEVAFYTLKANDLRRLIKRTIFATDTESGRYALGGVQVEFTSDGIVNFVATDTRRLAIDVSGFETTGSPEVLGVPPVIPKRAIKLLSSIVEDGDVQVALTKTGLFVKSGLVTLSSQFVEGRFPDWRRVMPGAARHTMEFVAGPFLDAMRQSMVTRQEESRGVEFSLSRGNLRLSSEGADVWASKVEIPVAYDGEPVKISFDPAYFADFLKVLESSSVVKCNLISCEDPGELESAGYRYVIMPLERR